MKTSSSTYNIMTLKNALRSDGWKETNFGHFHKVIDERRNRIKFQSISVRIEVRSTCETFWIKKDGGFYSKIKVDHEKKMIKVGKTTFPIKEVT